VVSMLQLQLAPPFVLLYMLLMPTSAYSVVGVAGSITRD